MISPIQLVLSAGVLIILWIFMAKFPPKKGVKVLVLFISCASIFFIFQPERTNDVANFLGVGRGADLVMYVGMVYIYLLVSLLYLRYRKVKEQVTKLSREIALLNSKRMQ